MHPAAESNDTDAIPGRLDARIPECLPGRLDTWTAGLLGA